MPQDNNPAQPVWRDRPISTTEEVLRLLGAQPHAPADDDALHNPELEQLLGSLSKGLEEGLPESALVTLEELAGAVPTLSASELQTTPGVCELVRVCAQCGYSNPPIARFCGMCGQGLAAGLDALKVPQNGASPLITAEPPKLVQLEDRTGASGWFKAVLLGALVLALVLVAYQKQLWRLPLLGHRMSDSFTAPAAPAPRATPPPQPNPAPNPAPPSVRPPLPAVHEPRTAKARKLALPQLPVKASPSAAAPTKSFAALAPRVNREAPVLPPAISAPSVPTELPAIIQPPSTSPVVQGAAAPGAADASSSPPMRKVAQLVPGVPIFKVNPQYPPAARSARVQGSVVMHAIIGTDGSVEQLRLISGNPLLVKAAMEAVKMWRYQPFLLDGKPVEGETDITINFKGE